MPSFTVARARLDRAHAHGEKLATLWNAIPSEDVFEIRARVTADGFGQIRVEQVKQAPRELSLVLGEMLYQLRSALDACVYEAARYRKSNLSEKEERSLEFPICSDPDEYVHIAKRRLWALPQEVQAGIAKVQPFNTPNLPAEDVVTSVSRSLAILNDLARKDRHRTLHVIGSWPLQIQPQFGLPPGVTVEWVKVAEPGIIKKFAELATFQLRGYAFGMPLRVNPNMTTQIGLDEPPTPCHSNDTFDGRLSGMINAVHTLVTAFENHRF